MQMLEKFAIENLLERALNTGNPEEEIEMI